MDSSRPVALVTGSSRGIGRAVAVELAASGHRLAVHYRAEREAAEATIESLAGAGHEAFAADVGDSDAAYDLVDAVVQRMGSIDVLVNNAGIYDLHPPASTEPAAWKDVWQRTIAINLTGPACLMHAAIPHMVERGRGRIINISSRGAFRGEPDAPAYGASKAGLNALSQSLAQALAPHGVFVGVVAPGFVETDMVTSLLDGDQGEVIRAQSPLGRVARPEEIARTVAFLASDGIGYLTGCIIDANGASYLRT